MIFVLSHVSSFEYWRLVGREKILLPRATNTQALPSVLDKHKLMPLINAGVLSAPLHGLTSAKQKNCQDLISHYRQTALPRGSIMAITSTIGIASPELTLLELTPSLTFTQTIALMCEFSGCYTVQDSTQHGLLKRDALTNKRRLKSYSERAKGMQGAPTFRRAIDYSLPGARSPMEVAAALLLTLPLKYGGYGLTGAELNPQIGLNPADKKNLGVVALKPDMLWRDSRVCVEYDSLEFHAGETRTTNDARRKNAFTNAGYEVITLTKTQLGSTQLMNEVAKHIARKIGKRYHQPNRERQHQLRRELLGKKSILRRQYQVSDTLLQDMMYLEDPLLF